MALQIDGTDVITEQKILQNVTGLKSINGSSILGSDDLELFETSFFGSANGGIKRNLDYNSSGNDGAANSSSSNRLFMFTNFGQENGSNGDIWITGSGGRVVTCVGGNTPNTVNQWRWNRRNFITNSGDEHYRSSNTSPATLFSIIYLDAGCRMRTDRNYFMNGCVLLTAPSSDDSLRNFAIAYFEGANP